MRRAAKVDANQVAIVAGLRKLGCSVQPLHAVGGGVPDLLVGYGARNYLLEVKNLEGRGKKLTPDQVDWHDAWRGSVYTVCSLEDAIKVMCIPVHGAGNG